MKTRRPLVLFLAMLMGGCGAPMVAPDQPPPRLQGGYQIQQAWNRIYPVNTYSSSEQTYQGTTFTASRATDANTDLEWASADWDSAPTYTMNFGQSRRFDRIRIKTGPSKGTTYRIETSYDGANWQDVSGPLSNSGWNVEDKYVSGQGNYLRVRFFNTSPPAVRHFSIFELEVYGGTGGGTAPPPPGAPEGLTYAGLTTDQMSSSSIAPDGTMDGVFTLTVNLPQPVEIRSITLYGLGTNLVRDGSIWNSAGGSNWWLGVTWPGSPAINSSRPTLGTFNAGTITFTLYATQYLTTFTRPGAVVEADVTFGSGSVRTFRRQIS